MVRLDRKIAFILVVLFKRCSTKASVHLLMALEDKSGRSIDSAHIVDPKSDANSRKRRRQGEELMLRPCYLRKIEMGAKQEICRFEEFTEWTVECF